MTLAMQERIAPSRPYRLGTHRRRAPQGRAASEVGASGLREAQPDSLDTRKYLQETSVQNWLKGLETPWDSYQSRVQLWRKVTATLYSVWQDLARQLRARPDRSEERQWWDTFEAEKAALKADQCPAYDAWLADFEKKNGLPECKEAYLHVLYLDHWKKKNRPKGLCAEALAWEKQYFQLLNCQSEWIGMRAACCGEKARPIAIAVGCNHRLCPLCNWRRTQNAQLRIKTVFDRIEHPQFLTFTVPNVKKISKRTFALFRKRVRQFLALHKDIFSGGVYAIETTYNQQEKSWHVHAHALVDCIFKLPKSDERVDFAGRKMRAFDLIKLALEYDWSRIWCKGFSERFSAAPRKYNKIEKNGDKEFSARAQMAMNGERYAFEEWVRGCHENTLKCYRAGKWVPITYLPEAEMRARTAWNLANRRVFWIKPVDDRDKAVKEVLKYITKCSEFGEIPECVRQFYDATKGTRLIQCFGSWYGIDFSAEFDTRHMAADLKGAECACGLNEWHRIGLFLRRDVEMEADGRWYLRRCFDHTAHGTLVRPTIRALAEREKERTGDR